MSDDGKDEIVVSFGQRVVFQIGPFGEAVTGKRTGGDGVFGMFQLPACAAKPLVFVEACLAGKELRDGRVVRSFLTKPWALQQDGADPLLLVWVHVSPQKRAY